MFTRSPLVPVLSQVLPVHIHPISLRSIIILSSHLLLCLPRGLFPSGFSDQNFVRISHISHACYIHLDMIKRILVKHTSHISRDLLMYHSFLLTTASVSCLAVHSFILYFTQYSRCIGTCVFYSLKCRPPLCATINNLPHTPHESCVCETREFPAQPKCNGQH